MPSSKPFIIAVDGPAGSGKSSVCAGVSAALGLTYVNTGLLYRAVGFLAQQEGVALDDGAALSRIARAMAEGLSWNPETRQLCVDERNITAELYTVESGEAASAVAKNAMLRESLLPAQRALALSAPRAALLDGRDIGTAVFPDADLKIFMSASLETRAKRRLAELQEKNPRGPWPSVEELVERLGARDRQDAGRASAPMIQAQDAHSFANDYDSVDAAVSAMSALIQKHLAI